MEVYDLDEDEDFISQMNVYQENAISTAMYPNANRFAYLALGLNGEAGEVAEIFKKMIRRGELFPFKEDREKVALELGDVLWYLALLSHELGLTLQEVADLNIDKLQRRKEAGTIKDR